MARVVCQVLSRPDRLTLIWSEGDAFFEPYPVAGDALAELRRRAALVWDRLGELAQAGASGAVGFALAEAGYALYRQLFSSDTSPVDAAREVRDWLNSLEAAGVLDSLEILGDEPGLVPWNAVYDRPPDEAGFRAGGDAWQGFWGARLNLTEGRRVDPLRQLGELEQPAVLLAIDPRVRASLPEGQQRRLAEFVQVKNLPVVEGKQALAGSLASGSVDVLYLLCPADAGGFLLGSDRLTPRELRDLLRGRDDADASNPTLVFVNACQAGGGAFPVPARLHAVGLTGFVAPAEPLPPEFASTQGLDLLTAFLYQGAPLGQALQRLRARTLPLGLVYAACCPPGLRVTWRSDLEEAVTTPDGRPAAPPAEGPEPVPLPETPYRPLTPYDMEDRPLLVGRDGAIERLAAIVDEPPTRILVLHGQSGVGKASLVRAGVIPYLEDDSVGYRFLRDRSEAEEGPADEADYPVLAIRPTHNFPAQLARGLCAYCARPYSYATPTGRTVVVDLPALLSDVVGAAASAGPAADEEDEGGQVAASSHAVTEKPSAGFSGPSPGPESRVPQPGTVQAALRAEGGLLARLLEGLSERLPHELVLLLEQAEELFTLTRDTRRRRRALDLLSGLAAASGRFKVIVSVRTQFFGRLAQRADGSPGWRSYLLRGLDAGTLAEAIELPTAREPVPYTDEIPFDKYGFAYDDGVARDIARDAVEAGREGRETPLPVVQVVCAQLADLARSREDRVVRAADWRALGGADGALARYVQAVINREWAARRDRRAVRGLLQRLCVRESGGTLVRDLVPETVLAQEWRGLTPLETVIDGATDDEVRLLEVTWMPYQGEETRFVSLAHDALLPVAAGWAREAEQRSHTQKRVVDTLFIAIPCILLALALAFLQWRQRGTLASEYEEFKKETAEDLKKKVVAEETVKGARWTSYLGNLGQARQAWEAGNLVALDQALLAPRGLREKEPDLRGFEWYYLWRLGHNERATLAGHRGLVSSVALSPDGTVLASGSADGTVKLWDAASGLERATFAGHKGPVHAVAVAGDGKLLASAGEDGAVRLWDATVGKDPYVRTDKSLAVLPGHTGPVRALAVTADGKTLASAGAGKKDMMEVGAIRLWDVAGRKELRALHEHRAPVNALAFTPDGKTLASGSEDHSVYLWETASGQKQRSLEGHSGAVTTLAFAGDGKTLASGGAGWKDGVEIGVVKLWDVDAGKERTGPAPTPPAVFALAFTLDGKTLVTGAKANLVQVWDVSTGQERRRLSGHVGWLRTLAVSADGKTLATGSFDNTARLWDLRGAGDRDVLSSGGWVCAVAVAPGGKLLASGGSDGRVQLWDPATGAEVATLKGHHGSVLALAFSPKGDRLASGSWDADRGSGEVKVWDADPTSPNFRKEQPGFAAEGKGATCLAFSPDGRTVASGGADHKVILWNVDGGQKRHEIAAHQDVVRCLAFSPEGRTLATGGDDTRIRLWEADGGKERQLPEPGGKDGAGGKPFEGHTAAVTGLAFSPDGLSLASASADRTVRLWDVGSGIARATLRGHGGRVYAVAFRRTGETLASGGEDGSVKLWDSATGAARYTLSGHSAAVRSVAFAADGNLLASGSHDGTVRLWRAAPPERPGPAPVHD
jgi:WD40 repeat protein